MAWPLDYLKDYGAHTVKAAAQGGMDEYIKRMGDQAARQGSRRGGVVAGVIGLTAVGATLVFAGRSKDAAVADATDRATRRAQPSVSLTGELTTTDGTVLAEGTTVSVVRMNAETVTLRVRKATHTVERAAFDAATK